MDASIGPTVCERWKNQAVYRPRAVITNPIPALLQRGYQLRIRVNDNGGDRMGIVPRQHRIKTGLH